MSNACCLRAKDSDTRVDQAFAKTGGYGLASAVRHTTWFFQRTWPLRTTVAFLAFGSICANLCMKGMEWSRHVGFATHAPKEFWRNLVKANSLRKTNRLTAGCHHSHDLQGFSIVT